MEIMRGLVYAILMAVMVTLTLGESQNRFQPENDDSEIVPIVAGRFRRQLFGGGNRQWFPITSHLMENHLHRPIHAVFHPHETSDQFYGDSRYNTNGGDDHHHHGGRSHGHGHGSGGGRGNRFNDYDGGSSHHHHH